MPSESLSDHGDEELRFRKGANWISENVKTLMRWIHISAIYIDILGESIKHYKRILRTSTIVNLILSSIASTVSISQYGNITTNYLTLDWFIKGGITLSTIIIALNAGYMKVYNIQEKVEKSIRLQQQWIEFGTTLSSELQLPVEHRKDALFFIIRMKDMYATLIKQHIVANRAILKKIALKNGVSADVLTLSDLLERSIQSEALRLNELEQKPLLRKQTVATLTTLPKDTILQMDNTPVIVKKYVPSVKKLVKARAALKSTSKKPQNILVSPRQQISSYVLEPSVIRTELPPVQEVDSDTETQDSQSVRSIPSVLTIERPGRTGCVRGV